LMAVVPSLFVCVNRRPSIPRPQLSSENENSDKRKAPLWLPVDVGAPSNARWYNGSKWDG
jgi:hypothetical protein